MSDDVQVLDCSRVDAADLDRFLAAVYRPGKCDFLGRHAEWLHRSSRNRMVLLEGGEIAGYSAVVPTSILVGRRRVSAAWWVDLIIHERYRGRRLQRHLDARARAQSDTMLGIPNALSAKIHRRHGWGVRENYRLRMLPLRPLAVVASRGPRGARGALARIGAALAGPAARLYATWAARRPLTSAWGLAEPDPEALAAVFTRHLGPWVTTVRDAAFIRWRYLASPHRDELAFFAAGESREAPSLAAVSRTLVRDGRRVTRLLDVFGDLRDRKHLAQLIGRVTLDAIDRDAIQVSCIATNAELDSALRSNGFLLSLPFRFCWISTDATVMQGIRDGPCHWCWADSDTDLLD